MKVNLSHKGQFHRSRLCFVKEKNSTDCFSIRFTFTNFSFWHLSRSNIIKEKRSINRWSVLINTQWHIYAQQSELNVTDTNKYTKCKRCEQKSAWERVQCLRIRQYLWNVKAISQLTNDRCRISDSCTPCIHHQKRKWRIYPAVWIQPPPPPPPPQCIPWEWAGRGGAGRQDQCRV